MTDRYVIQMVYRCMRALFSWFRINDWNTLQNLMRLAYLLAAAFWLYLCSLNLIYLRIFELVSHSEFAFILLVCATHSILMAYRYVVYRQASAMTKNSDNFKDNNKKGQTTGMITNKMKRKCKTMQRN